MFSVKLLRLIGSWKMFNTIKLALEIMLGLFIFLVLIGSAFVFQVWYMCKHQPRKPMVFCSKHGMMLPDHCVSLMDSAEIVDEYDIDPKFNTPIIKKSHIEHGIKYCPMCWKEKIFGGGN